MSKKMIACTSAVTVGFGLLFWVTIRPISEFLEYDRASVSTKEKSAPGKNAKITHSPCDFGDLKLGSQFTDSQEQVYAFLPPGTFEMGSPTTEAGRGRNEGKLGTHTVELTQGFFMGILEVTQRTYKTITGESPWNGQRVGGREGIDLPATWISWDDINDKFIPRLNAQERAAGTLPNGWEYRLPTEAQWEYAARAGTKTRFSFGDYESKLGEYAWFTVNGLGSGDPQRGGQKLPNQWGLYDMIGNVWEYTADWYGDYPSDNVRDPLGPDRGSERVARGGDWMRDSSKCRPAYRDWGSSEGGNYSGGFRLALVQSRGQ